jgi:hypothetical protein
VGVGVGDGLAVGVVVVAVGFATEGGGATAVLVGEDVAAEGDRAGWHGVGGLPPDTFRPKLLKGSGMRPDFWKSCLADSVVKSESPGPARTARGFACLSFARGAGL